jgi:hypothetical protein
VNLRAAPRADGGIDVDGQGDQTIKKPVPHLRK